MKTRPLFKMTLLTLLFMFIGGQWAWADGPLSKKDSIELVKAIKEYKKYEKNAYAELEKKHKKETDSEQAETLSKNTEIEIDKQLVNFISNHPKLMDFPEKALEELLNIIITTSPDGRIRYYDWILTEYENFDEISRVMQYRTDDGKIETCWDTPFYDDAELPWSYAFIPMDIYTFDHHGKRVYLVKEFLQDDVYTWEQLRAISFEKDKMVDVPIFDCEDIYRELPFAIYANLFYPGEEIKIPEKPSPIIGYCFNDTIWNKDNTVYETELNYDPTMREIQFTLSNKDQLYEQRHMKYNSDSGLFTLRTFPNTTDPTEIAVGQRVKAIMEDALDRYNEIEAPTYYNSLADEQQKIWDNVKKLDIDYCSQNWNELVDSIHAIDAQKEDTGFFEADYWVKGQDISDGPHLKLLSIDDIQKIDNNTYVVVYTFLKYDYGHGYTTGSVKMVRERGNWYIDDFHDGIGSGDWKDLMRRYIKEPW